MQSFCNKEPAFRGAGLMIKRCWTMPRIWNGSSCFNYGVYICPSQKLIHGKFVEKIFSSVQRLNEIPTVQFIRKDGFNVKFLIEVDSEHRSAKTVRYFYHQNDLSFQADFFHSYWWCNPPMRGKSIILHLPTSLGWIGRPLDVFFPRLKCVLSLW